MPDNPYTLVVVNGIDDSTEPELTRLETQSDLFKNWFPETDICVFNSISEEDGKIRHGYLRDKAKGIIGGLHTLLLERRVTNKNRRSGIVFLAHNTGAALVKQTLLLALEDRRYDWIALQTLALYFVEAPSYTDYREWEEFLFCLHSAGRRPLSNLAALIHVLPGELAHTEVEFSAIARAYKIERGTWSSDKVYDKEDDPWRFQKDKVKLADQKMADIVNAVRGSLRDTSIRMLSGYQRFFSVLSRPEAASGRLSAYMNPRPMAWLEKLQKYKDWLGRKRASLLAIESTLGSGKTHIASHVLYSLMTNNTDPKAVFLSFGFYKWDIKRNSEWHMVASLIRQLLMLRPPFFRQIETLARSFVLNEKIHLTQLWELFRYLLSLPQLSTVYIVVNAVDQCRDSVVDTFSSFVCTAFSRRQSQKILITGSDFSSLQTSNSVQRLTPGDLDWEGAVREVVADRVKRLVNKRPVWKEKEEKIVVKLCEGGFSYLSIMLNLDILDHNNIASTGAALEAQLMAPPISLDYVFTTLFTSVKASPMAILALRWIINAVSPLTVSELSVALALCPGILDYKVMMPSSFNELAESISWDIMADLAAYLGPAVKVSNDRVMLVHHSFRTHAEKEEKTLAPRFHALVASRCISYIKLCSKLMPAESLESVRLSRPSYGKALAFLEYAELYWARHYRLAGDSYPPLDDEVLEFLKATAAAPETNDDTKDESRDTSEDKDAAEAAREGDEGKTPADVNDGGDEQPDKDDSKEMTEMHDSEKSRNENGNEDESGEEKQEEKEGKEEKDEEKQDKEKKDAENQDDEKKDEDEDAKSDTSEVSSIFDPTFPLAPPTKKWPQTGIAAFGWPPNTADDHLYLAIQLGFTRIVDKVLLELTGASENVNERIRRATAFAALNGNLAMLEKLLAVGEPKHSALVAFYSAAKNGHMDIIDRLIQQLDAADVEDLKENNVFVPNPLFGAAETGQRDVVEALLKMGFNLSMKDNVDSTPVHSATSIGDIEMLKLMQSLNGERFKETLRVANKLGQWPIHMAATTGNIEVFSFLKDQDPEKDTVVKQLTAKGETMIQLCLAFGGSSAMLEKLIEAGAEVFGGDPTPIPDEFDYDAATGLRRWKVKMHTPLEIAARFSYVELVRPLLKQLDVWSSVDDGKATADERLAKKKKILDSGLFEAASIGSYEIVEILLGETERDPVMDANHMRLAVGRGHLQVVKLLEAAGIPLEDSDKVGYNSLFDLPISANYIDVLAYFISKGLRSQYDGDETSIQFAVRCGYLTSLRLLLDNSEDDPNEVRRKNSDSMTSAELAANCCNREAFKMITQWEVEHNVADASEKLSTAIVLAIKGYESSEMKVKFIEYLLSNDWDPNVNDEGQDIPLLIAISKHETEVVQLLLDTGANPDCADSIKRTGLHVAVEEGEVGVLKMLLEKGANPNVANSSNMMTPLLLAAQSGKTYLFAALLGLPDETEDELGKTDCNPPPQRPIADINMCGLRKQTALHIASDSPAILELYFDYFKKHGQAANPDPVLEKTLETPLMLAVQRGGPESVEALLKHTASVHAKDVDGSTPLQMVALTATRAPEEDAKIVKLLVEYGADVNAAGGKYGSPLNSALWNRNGDQTVLKLLLELGAQAGIQAPPFDTPLHVLFMVSEEIEAEAETLVPLLIKHGCDVNGIGARNRTALMYAVSHNRSNKAISKLLDIDADPNIGDVTGSRPLNYAPRHSSPTRVVLDLLAAGAEADLLDGCGRSVLYTAALVHHASDVCDRIIDALPKNKILEFTSAALPAAAKGQDKHTYEGFLRKPGIYVNVPDRSGWTALDVAEASGLDDLVRTLLDRGAVKGAAKKKPTRMSSYDMKDDLFVSEDGMEVYMKALTHGTFDGDETNGTVRADHSVQPDKGIFYFEMEVLECGHLSVVAVGFTRENHSLDDMAGWGSGSFGYHSDDGSFLSDDESIDQGKPYHVGDIVGVAYDPESQRIWFTVNGSEVACKSWAVPEKTEDDEAVNGDTAEPENGNAEDKGTKGENKDSDDSSNLDDLSEKDSGGDKTDGKEANGEGAEEKDKEEDNNSDNGSDNGSDNESTDRKNTKPVVVQGQFYPAVSLLQDMESVRVRVSFGVQADGTGQPFKYAPPTSVPK